ncbi:ionotropic receptor 21a [Aphidius gifuensis]|uniref:ionotropic receptor 21a n=1 Tax=Aphidius gifuensis TaxID=684658 RepID=UPI001CDD23D6|nr:ionotropic receptor 21a [Aphidius gifuensis]
MNLLLIIILIPTVTLQWITKDSTKKHGALSKRIESLSKLTEKIINNYFGGCVLVVLYDETYLNEKIDTIKKLFDAQPRVSYVQKKINLTRKDNNYVVADKCYNYLIFLNDVYDIGKVIGKETINKILIITESTPWTVKDYLRSHPSRFYTNLLIITHSMSRRTEAGSYLLYTHHLYTDGSGASEPVLLTSWIKDHPTDININYYPEKLNQGFKGHRLIVSVAHKPPYTIRKNIINRDIIDWDGIDIRLIKLLSKILNFTAEFRDPIASDSPIYASLTDVKNENSIIATGGIYKTINITNNYDTSLDYMEDCAAFISKSSTALPKYQAVLGPFDPSVWIFVSVIYLLAIIILTINTSYKFIELILKPNILLHMFWYVFSTFTNCFVIKNPLLNNGIAKNATSFLIGFYWVFTIIITSCYTGSIMAFITVPTFPAPIDTAEKLLNEKYTIGTLNHDGWESWFNYTNMTDPIGVRLLESINYVSNINDGIKNTSKAFFWPYAFLGSKLTLEYIAQDKFPPK